MQGFHQAQALHPSSEEAQEQLLLSQKPGSDKMLQVPLHFLKGDKAELGQPTSGQW